MGVLAGRPLGLCDVGDVDGIVSAALFLRKYPRGVVILAAPRDVGKWWIRSITWTFVADLPCPGRALIRADHHETNKPCAKVEFYDPEAPCSAIMAMKALSLDDDPVARRLVEIATETDTAKIVSREAEELDLAVRFANYDEKMYIVRNLARGGLSVLSDERVRRLVERGRASREFMIKLAEEVPIDDVLVIYSPVKLGISYRQLTIELERRGSRMVNILVKMGRRTYRYYCGAHRNGPYDCTQVATRLGGGGHRYASGAQFKAPLLRPEGLPILMDALRSYLGSKEVETLEINNEGKVIRLGT
jgi:nanoRNase/pAp phosphatase (c-di-AMP/oligoRNAs hydrolase)